MAAIESKSMNSPDETRTPDKTKVEVVRIAGREVGRFTFQPGWKWSECVKPVVKTDSCQAEHFGYVVSGQIRIVPNDGAAVDLGPGDTYLIPPGHDAWVLGQEPFVGLEFKSAATYAKN